MIEIVEQACGYIVSGNGFRESFHSRANALLAARILATAEAVTSQRDIDVLVPMGNGEVVRMDVLAAA